MFNRFMISLTFFFPDKRVDMKNERNKWVEIKGMNYERYELGSSFFFSYMY